MRTLRMSGKFQIGPLSMAALFILALVVVPATELAAQNAEGLSALAPENIARSRPAAAFDLTERGCIPGTNASIPPKASFSHPKLRCTSTLRLRRQPKARFTATTSVCAGQRAYRS